MNRNNTKQPLSNKEVLDVLRMRTSQLSERTQELYEYLIYIDNIKKSLGMKDYKMATLRNMKKNNDLIADIETLTIVSNMSDISFLHESDKNKIKSFFLE